MKSAPVDKTVNVAARQSKIVYVIQYAHRILFYLVHTDKTVNVAAFV